MSEKRKGLFLKGSLFLLAAVSYAPVALPPPPCHRGFIAVLMETSSTASCSFAITKVLLGHVQTPPGFGMIGSLCKRLPGSFSCTGLFPTGSEVFEQLSVCRLQLVLPLLPENCEPRDKQNKRWGREFLEILKLYKCYPEQVSCQTFLPNRWVNNYTGRKPHDWKTALEF